MKLYGEDLFEHCKFLNCYSCEDNVLERHLQRGMPHKNVNALYELVYHVNNGPVIVPVSLLERLFETNNIAKACFLLSKLTKRYVDYFPQLGNNKSFVRLEIEKENAGSELFNHFLQVEANQR